VDEELCGSLVAEVLLRQVRRSGVGHRLMLPVPSDSGSSDSGRTDHGLLLPAADYNLEIALR
jgi:hypothetical protein